MGLAGRDPVFHAQLELERAIHPELADQIDSACIKCHGVMGHRQMGLDSSNARTPNYKVFAAVGDDPDARYGALARDGISCGACHHMAEASLGTQASFTGNFQLGPSDELYGPYDETKPYAMEQGLGVTPKGGAWIRESKMCGSCHVVEPPILDVDKSYTPEEFGQAPTVHVVGEVVDPRQTDSVAQRWVA
jgi:hypothetical protein